MAQPVTAAKIEELRARVKGDPKSRLFYPLAEELRKVGQLQEAEDVLVAGLAGNPSYLSAWVGLGRVLREEGKLPGAIEALNKALTVDRENIVVARLLAEIYLELGEKVEAIKKFKLVHALLPADLEVEAQINQLERDLNSQLFAPVAVAPDEDVSAGIPIETAEPLEVLEEAASQQPAPVASDEVQLEAPAPPTNIAPVGINPSPFVPSDEEHLWQEDSEAVAASIPQAEPLSATGDEVIAEESVPFATEKAGAALGEVARPLLAATDLTATVTMGDLYAQQGYNDSARDIYEKILASHPDDDEVRMKLRALPTPDVDGTAGRRRAVAEKLEGWLAKVVRREGLGRV